MKRAANLLGLVAILVLTGCAGSSPAEKTGGSVGDGRPAESDIPEFTGPWAEDFRDYYRYTTTDEARQILSDGVITAAEYAEVRESFIRCAEEHGVKIIAIDFDGSREFSSGSMSSKEANDLVIKCEDQSGDSTVGALWHQMQRNPARVDEDELVLGCLRRVGAVEAGLTVEQYREERRSPQQVPPSQKEIDCTRDPNGTRE